MKYELSTTLRFPIDTEKNPDFLLQLRVNSKTCDICSLARFKGDDCVECSLLSTVSWLADCIDFSKYTKEDWRIKEIK